eukprot:GFKZ01006136.1.p1 GENE.GFKZ01006136.1~~GFKZ01006136.1.p1  ORF type:complete len:457 (+),score=58.65 GFKZ01006136.1:137-1372(+)
MIHGLKVSMAKGTGKREILGTDESHNITASVLAKWKGSLKSLHDALAANETAWSSFLTTYTFFNNAAYAVYSDRDVDARSILKSLEEGRAAAQAQPTPVEGAYSAAQAVEISRQEIMTMLSRIGNAEALHLKRLEATREYRYYDRKTKQMLDAERRKGSVASSKEVERRSRNQKKVMDLAVQLNSITTQLYTELEYIDMERLAIADRATAALLTLQKSIFESNPAADAINRGNMARIGRRVIPRDEVREWMPNTLHPANPNPKVPNPNLSNSSIPTPAQTSLAVTAQVTQAYPSQGYYSSPSVDQNGQQPALQQIPSAPIAMPYTQASSPMQAVSMGMQPGVQTPEGGMVMAHMPEQVPMQMGLPQVAHAYVPQQQGAPNVSQPMASQPMTTQPQQPNAGYSLPTSVGSTP